MVRFAAAMTMTRAEIFNDTVECCAQAAQIMGRYTQ